MHSRIAKTLLTATALALPLAPMAFAADTTPDAHLAAGKQLFEDWGCAACHTMADAGASGHVGPAFDGNAGLTKDFTITRITNGQGAMPSFGGLMTEEEIDTLADYIVAKRVLPQ